MDDADVVSRAIASNWEQWAPLIGPDREQFEGRLTILLRKLDEADQTNKSAAIRAILKLFQRFKAVHAKLVLAIRDISAAEPELETDQGTTRKSMARKGGARKGGLYVHPLSVKKERHQIVPVFYGTARAVSADSGVPFSYSGERGDLAYGVANVSIPDDHREGEIEKPKIWKLQFRENPDAHVVVLGIEPLAVASFTDRAIGALDRCSRKEVLVFVHGYNVGFDAALQRAAQVAYDLQFSGLPALFSWPSEGSMPKYTVDWNNIDWSRSRFKQFLKVLREKLGAETVHIIAHSMGSRLVAETIAAMGRAQTKSAARLRQIVFAAPDIDAATFRDLANDFSKKAERFTLYASSRDKALQASRKVNKYPRAGYAGDDLVIVQSVDTVDASAVDTSLMAHSYFGDSNSVIRDLFHVICDGTPPELRNSLAARNRSGKTYWAFTGMKRKAVTPAGGTR